MSPNLEIASPLSCRHLMHPHLDIIFQITTYEQPSWNDWKAISAISLWIFHWRMSHMPIETNLLRQYPNIPLRGVRGEKGIDHYRKHETSPYSNRRNTILRAGFPINSEKSAVSRAVSDNQK